MQPVSIRQAATELGVAPVTVRAWLRQRRLPHYKVGPRRVVISREDLDAYLVRCRTEAAPAKEACTSERRCSDLPKVRA